MGLLELLTLGKAGTLGLLLFKGGTKALKILGKEALKKLGADELLTDLLEIPADLGVELKEGELKARIAALPPEQVQLGNQHLVRFTGAVLQRLAEASVEDLPHKPDTATMEGALQALPDTWARFVESGHQDIQPLRGQDVVRVLGKVLRGEPDVIAVDLAALQTFFAVWVRQCIGPAPIEKGLHLALAEAVGRQLGQALSEALPENHPLAGQAHATFVVRAFAELERYGIEAQKHDNWVQGTLTRVEKKLDDLREQVAGAPFDFVKELNAYAETVMRLLAPLPLTQILNKSDIPRIAVGDVFTPLKIRAVAEHHVSRLAHAKELADWDQREADHDAPDELKKRKQELDEFLRSSPALDAVETLDSLNGAHHVLLGEPGGGKTLLARHLATSWAEEWLRHPQPFGGGAIPLYVELKHYAQVCEKGHVTSLEDYLGSEHYPYHALDVQALADAYPSGILRYILDGLDEVLDPELKKKIISEVLEFDGAGEQVVLTSRIHDFDAARWRGNDLWIIHRIDPLTSAEQAEFIERYHASFFPEVEERERRIDRLHLKLRDFHRLAELAGTPLLLTLLCLVNRDPALPETRTELYEQAADLLLHHWDFFHFQSHGVHHLHHLPPLARAEKHAIMRRLTWLLMMGGQQAQDDDTPLPCERQHLSANLFPTALVEAALRQVLREVSKSNIENYVELLPKLLVERNSVLCPASEGKHSFIHRTFLEFYAAWAWKQEKILWNDSVPWRDRRWPLRMTPQERFEHLYRPHWQDSVWRVILILHCARYDDAEEVEEILRALIAVSDDLATRAGPDPEGESRMDLQLQSQSALLLAAEATTEIKERGRLPELLVDLQRRVKDLAASTFSTVETTGLQDGQNWQQRTAAVHLAVQLPLDKLAIVPWLRQISGTPELGLAVREASVQELAGVWGKGNLLQEHLLGLLGRPSTSGNVQNMLFRQIDVHWGQAGLDTALNTLAGLDHIETLDLSVCTGLRSTQGLPPLPALRKLSLGGCTRLGGTEALQGLTGLDRLVYLDLTGCTSLRSTQGLPPLPNLEKLSLRHCTGLKGAEALHGLIGLERLEALDLTGCTGLDKQALAALRRQLPASCAIVGPDGMLVKK